MDSSVFEYFDIFLLVLARMGGLVFINPVFSRRGVPPMVRTGLVLALSLLIAPGVRSGAGQVMAFSTFDMVESLIREVILGLVIGCVFHIFFICSMWQGTFWTRCSDWPWERSWTRQAESRPLFWASLSTCFLPLFFATGCHLTMVRLFAYSYQVVPVGAGAILGGRILWYIITLFGSVFLMVIKLVLPFVAAEFILEMTMGVLMKLIPQIHVFVINIQCKILLGIMLMMLFAYPMGAFMDRYTEAMMTEAQKLLMMFG